MPKLRSVNSIVIAPASTGSASSSRKAVTRIDQTNSGIRCSVMPGARMLKIVVMKLIAPMIDEAPARCSEKIAMSIDGPGMPGRAGAGQRRVDRPADPGAVAVDPRPTDERRAEQQQKDGTSSQKLMLFMRGKAMSGAPIISGTNQLPNPPIIAGMTTKNTMIRPCAVTMHVVELVVGDELVGRGASAASRMTTDNAPPISPAMIANSR